MSEPTRQPTLTLRASTSNAARSRSRNLSTAVLVTPRASSEGECTVHAAEHNEHRERAERTLSSDHLLQGRSHVFIAHNGERYQLRATRLGKLILTK
ncbi:hemin uptake protein HemP [Trinickia soli]|uniref:Hemin uptake protein HemP n=1 Tax=Trinickia soli TaxID=380675 RepID=A0A2N7VND6_9BURK|nr:hemin uptake protein HemP [Trinickia soli]KAA0082901.1 hemin uptake protein HemP [Paraburkholderia sp. T12-10]PMS18650.1 hemin uptake protein HemP [Trinickia soli]